MSHITLKQRYEIQAMVNNRSTQKEIAMALGKSESAISRKLKRNNN